MNAAALVYYIFSLTVGLGSVVAGLRLARRHDAGYLTSFSYFLIAFTLSGFLNLIARFLALMSLPNLDLQARMSFDINFGFLISPFLAAALVFFFRFICELIELRVRPAVMNAAAVGSFVFLFLSMAAAKYHLSTQNAGLARRMIAVVNTSVLVVYIVLCGLGLAKAGRLANPGRKTLVRTIAACYAAEFFLLLVIPWSRLHAGYAHLKTLPLVVFYFGANVAPIFVIRKFLAAPPAESSPAAPDPAGLSRFCERFGLTPREKEVTALLVRGLSYKDIEAGLFISGHTVKNHIHNIYRKCGAKNRYQVLSKIRESRGGSLD